MILVAKVEVVSYRLYADAVCGVKVPQRLFDFKSGLRAKIEKANQDLAEIKYQYKTN